MKSRVTNNGMGGFLCPPGHPMLTHSVETDLHRRPENRGGCSLEYAVTAPEIEESTKAVCRTLLNTWAANKPALNSPAVKDWIRQCLGYFKGCYNFQPENETGWHAGHLTIDSDLDPMEHADHHAGVHLIRRYYPEYQPCRLDFLRAYWGQKPGKTRKAAP